MNLNDMGQNLRRERERQGLTIDEVVQRTKISKSNILAMEAGNMDELPHPVYAKGFARNYAKLLKLDPEEYASAMGREFVTEDNVGKDVASDEFEEQIPLESSGNGLKILVLGLALLAMVIGGAIFMFSSPASEAPSDVLAPAHVEQPAVEQHTTPVIDDTVSATEVPVEADVEQQAAGTVQDEVARAEQAVQDAAPVVTGHAASTDAMHDPSDSRERVVVEAEEPCWVLAEVDGGENGEGGVTVDVMLQPGQSKLLRFHKTLVVKLGNGGGVKVTYNGQPYSFTAQSGQVKTLLFPAP
ncbi:helix-turn-helix domain-containing protein [Desulfovibrio ferrophilus]|uniref:Transcriptional regulator, XRE family n=1 Tax=Desulfovibrio ferrophilus TaxID=241368 RepID=A0A2Z6AWJ7_9BACT|nr:RodZ domain-containing protein [Desulfovibrio ferrophilus]BBD07619.1 transcriptional regulator, XRE family [Desulfovibrio ferrophilus]